VHQLGNVVAIYERAFLRKIRNEFTFSMSAPIVRCPWSKNVFIAINSGLADEQHTTRETRKINKVKKKIIICDKKFLASILDLACLNYP
jgi:hypothetical protein